MNEENKNLEPHPLHMLDNQADPATKPKIVLQKSIRTYESDMAEAMSKKNTSVTSMAVAEQMRRAKVNTSIPQKPQTPIQNNPRTFSTKKIDPMAPITMKQHVDTTSIEAMGAINVNNFVQPVAPTPEPQPEPKPEQKKEYVIGQPIDYSAANNISDKGSGSGIGKKIFMLLLSLIFIAAGLGGGYYLYTKSPLAIPKSVPVAIKIPSIVPAEFQKIIPIGEIKSIALSQKIQTLIIGGSTDTEKITEFILTQTKASTTIRVSGPSFIELLNAGAPEALKRSLVDNWMLGFYNGDGEQMPFIILKTDFFQNAYAGMLKWESVMPDELATLLGYKEKIRIENSNGTSTLSSYFLVKGKFTDKVILNRDVREFITDKKTSLLLYSFVDKDTLVITTSPSVLRTIIQRLENQVQIR